MFAIDLLKGQGLPQKVNVRKRVVRTVGLFIPLAALACLAGAWQYDRVQLTAQEKQIRENKTLADRHQEQISAYQQVNARIEELNKQFGEVSKLLCSRVQVSDLFCELVEQLPADIFFYEIKLDRTATKEKSSSDSSKKAEPRMVIRRSVTLVLCDFNTPGGDRLVQDYIAGLKTSKVISSVFKEIKPAARQQGTIEDRDATYYYIECVLQEQIQQ